jgi:hypothetical protein
VHHPTRHPRARRTRCGLFAAAAIACAVAFGIGPLAAQEPGQFLPEPLIAEAETAAHDELRISPIVTQSFLQATAGTAPENATVELPELLPAPASLPAADSRPETVIMETGPPGVVAVKPPVESTVPGCETDDRDIPLTLAEVLDSVRIHFPLLQAVERERAVAAGRLTSAMGAFDTNLNMSGNALAPGTYENYRSDMGLSQMLTVGGISLFGGYRTGFGDFPTYNLGQKTADAGEWRGGVNVPLARNREIDRQRATRAQAQLDVSLAEPVIERSRLDYMRSAARAYWSWMGTGRTWPSATVSSCRPTASCSRPRSTSRSICEIRSANPCSPDPGDCGPCRCPCRRIAASSTTHFRGRSPHVPNSPDSRCSGRS